MHKAGVNQEIKDCNEFWPVSHIQGYLRSQNARRLLISLEKPSLSVHDVISFELGPYNTIQCGLIVFSS